MYNTLIIVSRSISKASTVPMMESEVLTLIQWFLTCGEFPTGGEWPVGQ